MRISGEVYLDDYVTKAKACYCCPWPACQKTHEIGSGKYRGFKGGNYWAAQPVALGSLIDNDDLAGLQKFAEAHETEISHDFELGWNTGWAFAHSSLW